LTIVALKLAELMSCNSKTHQNSSDVVVKHFGNNDVETLVFTKSCNKLRSQLFDGFMSVHCQQVAYWLLVITRHKYYTCHRTASISTTLSTATEAERTETTSEMMTTTTRNAAVVHKQTTSVYAEVRNNLLFKCVTQWQK